MSSERQRRGAGTGPGESREEGRAEWREVTSLRATAEEGQGLDSGEQGRTALEAWKLERTD
jgi:hypothetical protein